MKVDNKKLDGENNARGSTSSIVANAQEHGGFVCRASIDQQNRV